MLYLNFLNWLQTQKKVNNCYRKIEKKKKERREKNWTTKPEKSEDVGHFLVQSHGERKCEEARNRSSKNRKQWQARLWCEVRDLNPGHTGWKQVPFPIKVTWNHILVMSVSRSHPWHLNYFLPRFHVSWAYSALARTIFGKIVSSQENKWYTWKTCKRGATEEWTSPLFKKKKIVAVIFVQEASTTQANLVRK